MTGLASLSDDLRRARSPREEAGWDELLRDLERRRHAEVLAELLHGPQALDGGEPEPEPEPELRLVPLAEFASVVEPSAEALLGTDDDAAFTAGGTVITYGDGGQGKTTLVIDGIAHLASGGPWLGLAVPRSLRIVVVENEGPRGRFRRKLRRKLDAWTGPPFAERVLVLDEPWGEFTFADDAMRTALAHACAGFGADVLVIGPLVTVGAEGGGTPEEVARFEALLARFRAELAQPLLVWVAHHENKAGDVSGAWERLPDTLMHTRIEGRATKLHWRKVRWSSELHDEHWTLQWTEPGEGFERIEQPERDVRAELLALWQDDPERWRTPTEAAATREKGGIGRARDDVVRELDALVAEGAFERETAPEGRPWNAVCYRPQSLDSPSSQANQATLSGGPKGVACLLAPPVRGASEAKQGPPEQADACLTPDQASERQPLDEEPA